jgi:hypothetical protein
MPPIALTCRDCGRPFEFREREQEKFRLRNWRPPSCRFASAETRSGSARRRRVRGRWTASRPSTAGGGGEQLADRPCRDAAGRGAAPSARVAGFDGVTIGVAADRRSETFQNVNEGPSCGGCGRPFQPRRGNQRYCGGRCRVLACRQRKAASTAGAVEATATGSAVRDVAAIIRDLEHTVTVFTSLVGELRDAERCRDRREEDLMKEGP